MPQYSAADIVGHNLTAAKTVNAVAYPVDNAPVLGQFTNNQNIGVVAGYVEAKPEAGRNYLYWMFNDAYGNVEFWVRHEANAFHYGGLDEQGVKDIAQQLAEQDLANLPWYERLIKQYGPAILITVAIIAVGSAGVRGYFSRPRN